MSGTLANIIGFVGSGLIVAAYLYLTLAKAMNGLLYNGLNLAGAALLLVSLTVHYNLPTIILEIVWITVALIGLWRAWQERTGTPSA